MSLQDLPIADLGTVRAWSVGSSDGKRAYLVTWDSEGSQGWRCECPDMQTRQRACKHVKRVQLSLGRSDICRECGCILGPYADEGYCRPHFEEQLVRALAANLGGAE